MKISKNDTIDTKQPSVKASKSYAEAQKHIRAAIDCLGRAAKDNIIAQESIANLSVVLLDLQ